MVDAFRDRLKKFLGVARRGSGRIKGAWWQHEEVKQKVKAKQEAYNALVGSGTEGEKRLIQCVQDWEKRN